MSVLCALFPLFLGAAIAVPVVWFISRRLSKAEKSSAGTIDLPFGILWLTAACRAALGRCGTPGRLRRMRPECVERLLNKAPFPAGESVPTHTMYSTWPMQADLICKGEFSTLREWQFGRLDSRPADSGDTTPPGDKKSWTWSDSDRRVLLLTLVLLAISFLFQYFARNRCASNVKEKVVVKCIDCKARQPLKLSADQLFEYDKPDIRPAHRAIVKAQLIDYFKDYNDITITGISAHTDPIGTDEHNRWLADQRAKEVVKIFQEVAAQESVHKHFKPETTISNDVIRNEESPLGPGREDYPIWRECFTTYFVGSTARILDEDRALTDLPGQGRTPCSMATSEVGKDDGKYPACARKPLPRPGDTAKHTAFIGRQFTEIVECLAPMRHVLVGFTATETGDLDSSQNDVVAQGGK